VKIKTNISVVVASAIFLVVLMGGCGFSNLVRPGFLSKSGRSRVVLRA
jgi:hypothetical protein